MKMGLNYSTAKTIVFVYRKKLKLSQNRGKDDLDKPTASESESRNFQTSFKPGKQAYEISCSIGGNPSYGAHKVCSFRPRTSQDRPIQI